MVLSQSVSVGVIFMQMYGICVPLECCVCVCVCVCVCALVFVFILIDHMRT